jgi:hypothetical protein
VRRPVHNSPSEHLDAPGLNDAIVTFRFNFVVMAAALPSEERELSLLDKVELRIALAETDDKLQGLLKTYLVPVLVKLTSPHLKVRNKV